MFLLYGLRKIAATSSGLDYALAEIERAAQSGPTVRGIASKKEPFYLQYGPRVHYGRSKKHGAHFAIRYGGMNIHFYKDRVFLLPEGVGRGLEIPLSDEHKAIISRLMRERES